MPRKEEPEEHENHERWLVTYADMVTLLMVLFIVMFSMSVVDERKFNALKQGLAAGFGQSNSVLTGSESILEQPGVSSVEPINRNVFAGSSPEELKKAAAQQYADASQEVGRLRGVMEELDGALKDAGLRGDVKANIDERGLVLSLTSRHVVFEPDLAALSERGERVLDTVAPVLQAIGDDLEIDGHTNQVPVKPKYYPTDWELSAARAITVLRHLNEQGGIPNDRMMAAAYGHEKPLVDPSKPGSQRVNKRVDIVIVSDLPAATRELLDDVAAEQNRAARGKGTPESPEVGTDDPETTHETDDESAHAEGTATDDHDDHGGES